MGEAMIRRGDLEGLGLTAQTLHEQVQTLLDKVEATPVGPWHIQEEEHALMVFASEMCGVPLPVSAFRSSEGAAQFLRAVLCATEAASDRLPRTPTQRLRDGRLKTTSDAESQDPG